MQKQNLQGIYFCREVKKAANSFCKEVEAVQKYKLQGIGFYRVVEYIGISIYKGFIKVKDLLKQGIY